MGHIGEKQKKPKVAQVDLAWSIFALHKLFFIKKTHSLPYTDRISLKMGAPWWTLKSARPVETFEQQNLPRGPNN